MEVAAAKHLLPTLPPPRDPTSPSSSSSAAASPPPRQQHQHRVIDTTPFPTTFVQADTASFKQVVQMLTGSGTSAQKPAKNNQSGAPSRPKKPAFKLYERRSGLKNLKTIAPLAAGRKTPDAVLSPSVLDFPSLALGSPVTPLVADPFNRSPGEEAAVERQGFFLHPSPRSAEPPRLLPLFPVTSPRAPESQ